MPMFYVHIRCGEIVRRDDEGFDLPNADSAKEEAIASSNEIVADAIKFGQRKLPDSFIVADAEGRELIIVPVRDLLPPHLRSR